MKDLIKDQISPSFLEFVRNNIDTKLDRLLLSSSKEIDFDLKKAASQIQSLRKAKTKIPSWFLNKEILFPPKISMEQCSSEKTAELKASFFSGDRLLDMTTGAGVDTFYFSKYFREVIGIEQEELLAEIASYNLEKLKADNVRILNGDSLDYLRNHDTLFDMIYVDPARRGEQENRIFQLRDCFPDIVSNIDLLLSRTKRLLVKVSPFLDITDTIAELHTPSQVYIISVKNEVKEVLYLISDEDFSPLIKTYNITDQGVQNFEFQFGQRIVDPDIGEIKKFIYEPNSSILKGGGMNKLASERKLSKLSQHSQLFTSSEHQDDFPGRVFLVEEVIEGSSKANKKILKDYRANIIARNYPLNAEQIAKKYNITSMDEESYLIFTKSGNDNTIIKSRKIIEHF